MHTMIESSNSLGNGDTVPETDVDTTSIVGEVLQQNSLDEFQCNSYFHDNSLHPSTIPRSTNPFVPFVSTEDVGHTLICLLCPHRAPVRVKAKRP